MVFCSVCDIPHHLSCWQENQGCTTFGCTGSIKEILAEDTPAVTPPFPTQTPPSRTAPPWPAPKAPKQETQTLYTSNEMVFFSGVPIMLENAAIIADPGKEKLYAQCSFRNISDQVVKAALIELTCHDTWGTPLGKPISFQYLDLNTSREATFGQAQYIELPDRMTRRFHVSVKKVLLGDHTIAQGGDVVLTMPAPEPLIQRLGSDALAAEYARETTGTAQFVPEITARYWRCTCGCVNAQAEEVCHHCGCTCARLISALDRDALTATIRKRAAQKQAIAEQARREQEERLRQEQLRKEQAQAMEQKKKRRKRICITSIISATVTAVLAAAAVFFGIPYYTYRTACNDLNTGRYDDAHQAFLELDGFMDSEILAKEALYQKACKYEKDKNYQNAIAIFEQLSGYKDSGDKIHPCMYGYIQQHLSSTNLTTYNYICSLIDASYRDAEDIYEELYGWRVNVLGWNSDLYSSEYQVEISKNSPVYCHIILTGGTPGSSSTRIRVSVHTPDGSQSEKYLDGQWDNMSTGWCGWSDGIFRDPKYARAGKVYVYFYDDDNNRIGYSEIWLVD